MNISQSFNNIRGKALEDKIQIDAMKKLFSTEISQDVENRHELEGERRNLEEIAETLDALYQDFNKIEEPQAGEMPGKMLAIFEKRWEILNEKYSLFSNLQTFLKHAGQSTESVDKLLDQVKEALAKFGGMIGEDPLFSHKEFQRLLQKNIDHPNFREDVKNIFYSLSDIASLEKKIEAKANPKPNLAKDVKDLAELRRDLIRQKEQLLGASRELLTRMRENAQNDTDLQEGLNDLHQIDSVLSQIVDKRAAMEAKNITKLRKDIKKSYKEVIESNVAEQAAVRSQVVQQPQLPQNRNFLTRIGSAVVSGVKSVAHKAGEMLFAENKESKEERLLKLPDEIGESWVHTAWGELILSSLSKKDADEFEFFIHEIKEDGRNSKMQVNELEVRKKSGENVEDKLNALEQERNAKKMIMHNSMLLKTTDAIRAQQKDIRRLTKEIEDAEKDLEVAKQTHDVAKIRRLEYEIPRKKLSLAKAEENVAILDSAFSRYFSKYTLEFEKKRNENVLGKAWNSIKRLAPVDYLRTPTELYREKKYADFGTSAKECLVKDFFGPLRAAVEAGNVANITNWFQSAIPDFMSWSDRHPEEAAVLIGDIMQTIDTLLGKGGVDVFKDRLTALSYVCANFAKKRVREPITNEDDLKFFALADYSSRAVTGANLGKGLADGYIAASTAVKTYVGDSIPFRVSAGVVGGLARGFYNVTIGEIERDLANLVPIEATGIVNAISGIMGGEEIYTVFETQQNEAIKDLVFSAQSAVTEEGFFSETKSQIRIWWNTIWSKESTPEERTARIWTQVVLPVAGTLAFLGGVAVIVGASLSAAALAITPIGWGLMAFAGLAYVLTLFSNNALNVRYAGTYNAAREAEISRILSSGKNGKSQNQLVADYLKNLREVGLIPDVSIPTEYDRKLTSKHKNEIKKVKDHFKKELAKEIKETISAKDSARIFANMMEVQKVRENLEEVFKEKFGDELSIASEEEGRDVYLPGVDTIELCVREIIKDLETEWLADQIEKALKEDTLRIYKATNRESPMFQERLRKDGQPVYSSQKTREGVKEFLKKQINESTALSDSGVTEIQKNQIFLRLAQAPSAPNRELLNPPAEVPVI